ncbi:transposase [Terrimonas pollutisoli]|uniref:transposase n=1 Tax=Terrimonas pollutisoli TaxID=3034147 RepID=UPI0034DF4033
MHNGIIQNRKSIMIAVHCMPGHIFIGFKPVIEISNLVKEIKVASTGFINDNKWVNRKFNWQEGYGVFSYSQSHIDKVAKYTLNQETHHKREPFGLNIPNFSKAVKSLMKNIFSTLWIKKYLQNFYYLTKPSKTNRNEKIIQLPGCRRHHLPGCLQFCIHRQNNRNRRVKRNSLI